MIDSLTNSEDVQNIQSKYLVNVVYDKLNPSSILIESPILILASLTVTSVFILVFVIIAIRRLNAKLKEKTKKAADQKPKESNPTSNNSRKSMISKNENLQYNSRIPNLDFANSKTYQKIKAELNSKKRNMEEFEEAKNNEPRRVEVKTEDRAGTNKIATEGGYEKHLTEKRKQSLSLSGPIFFEGRLDKLEKWGREMNLKNQLEKEVGSVEQISSIKSASGLPSVFEIDEENKDNFF